MNQVVAYEEVQREGPCKDAIIILTFCYNTFKLTDRYSVLIYHEEKHLV